MAGVYILFFPCFHKEFSPFSASQRDTIGFVWLAPVRSYGSLAVLQENLSRFDSSQVWSEMPFFKRQKSRRSPRLGLSCALVCVRYLRLVMVLSSRTAAIISICYADLSSNSFVYCSTDYIQLIYAVLTWTWRYAETQALLLLSLFLCEGPPHTNLIPGFHGTR